MSAELFDKLNAGAAAALENCSRHGCRYSDNATRVVASCGRLEFDEATFDLAVHGPANKPAFLGCSIVVEANARTTFVGGDDRVLERAFSEPMEVSAENGLEIQLIAALE